MLQPTEISLWVCSSDRFSCGVRRKRMA